MDIQDIQDEKERERGLKRKEEEEVKEEESGWKKKRGEW